MRELRYFYFVIWLPAFVVACAGGMGCRRAESIPGIVQGASMAPNWLGEHQLLICEDCRFPIRFQLDETDTVTRKIVCPNCGYPESPISKSTVQPAQAASILRVETISRWDVVAAQLPDSRAFGIKRVIGLPNEIIEIRDGDLYANGQKLIKSWEVQKGVRMLIFDSAFQPQLTAIGDRWSCEAANSGWQEVNGRWRFSKNSGLAQKAVEDPREWKWLNYHHWRCCAHQGKRDDLHPIEDIDTFNPSRTRSLYSLTDACFEIRFRTTSDSELGWRYYRGSELLEFRLNVVNSQLSILQQPTPESELAEGSETASLRIAVRLPERIVDPSKNNLIEMSTFDGQLLVFINGQHVIDKRLSNSIETGEMSRKKNSKILEIGACMGQLEIQQVRIWRDIFYLPEKASLFSIPAETFFLLGDNVPVSVDSRHWKPGGILKKDILGIVKPAANQ
jgi:signal peptidase I